MYFLHFSHKNEMLIHLDQNEKYIFVLCISGLLIVTESLSEIEKEWLVTVNGNLVR